MQAIYEYQRFSSLLRANLTSLHDGTGDLKPAAFFSIGDWIPYLPAQEDDMLSSQLPDPAFAGTYPQGVTEGYWSFLEEHFDYSFTDQQLGGMTVRNYYSGRQWLALALEAIAWLVRHGSGFSLPLVHEPRLGGHPALSNQPGLHLLFRYRRLGKYDPELIRLSRRMVDPEGRLMKVH